MSKALKAKVTLDVKSATKKLDLLAKKINAIDKSVNKTVTNSSKLAKQFNNATSSATKLKSALDQCAKSSTKVKLNTDKASSALDEAGKKLKNFLAAFTGVMALRVVVDTSDTITSAENRLNAMNGSDTKATQDAMDKMYAAAQRSRTGYADMMQNVSKSMTLAPDAFQGNIDNAIRFQEIMGKTYALGGASAAEQSSSMYQLIQGLGSGILQGDELRSVREGAPLAYQAIEEFARGIYGAEENLKDLASEGKITSDIVVAAMMDMGTKVDEKFAETSMTFAQAGVMIKNTATKAFEPVLQKLNDFLNSDSGKAVIEGLADALIVLANIAGIVLDAIAAVVNFVYENWSWMQYIVYAIGLAVIAVLGMITAHMIAKSAIWIWSIIKTRLAFLGWIVVIGLIVGALVWLTKSTGSMCDAIVQISLFVAYAIIAILMVILIVYLATGVIMLSIPTLIGLAIIAVLAILVAVFLTWTGEIVGFAYGLGAAISAVFENIKLAFTNILTTMKYLFWKFVDTLLTAVKPLIEVINGISSLFGGGTIDVDFAAKKAEEYSKEIGFVSIGDAYKTGYAKGHAIGEGIQNKINSFGEKLTSFSINDAVNGATNLDPSSSGAYNDDLVNGVNTTADNTGDIADSMDLTNEDLEYLRRIADMEWKKEYTTANITVDMKNNNTINNKGDLDGWVTILTDKLYEELDMVANGVYS